MSRAEAANQGSQQDLPHVTHKKKTPKPSTSGTANVTFSINQMEEKKKLEATLLKAGTPSK